MYKRTISLAMVVLMVLSILTKPTLVFAEQKYKFITLDVTNSGSIDLLLDKNTLFGELYTTKAGFSSIYLSVTGVEKEIGVTMYNCNSEELQQAINAMNESGDSNYFMANHLIRATRTIKPNEESFIHYVGGETQDNRFAIFIKLNESEDLEAAKPKITIRSDFAETVSESIPLESGKTYDICQSQGTLYWPIHIDSLSRIRFEMNGPNEAHPSSFIPKAYICSRDKKDISFCYEDEYMIIKSGDYYLRTTNISDSGITRGFFVYNASPVNAKIGNNTSKSKAKVVSFGKKYSDVITTYPKFKPRYYKIKLKGKKKISIVYNNEVEKMICYELISDEGKSVNSKKCKEKEGKVEMKIPKDGVYYLKTAHYFVNHWDNGVFSFRIR